MLESGNSKGDDMRYANLEKYSEIGQKGHQMFQQKNVAIVGMGNIGSTVAVMLIQSGINLRIVDKGRVDVSDLSSQSMYLEEDNTKFKAKQAKKYLEMINPSAKVRTFHEDLTKNNIYLIDADIVVDATGDLETSKLISEETKKKKIPLIYAVVSGGQGLVIATDKGVNLDKIKPSLDKMKPIEEKGIINPAVHMAAAIIVTKIMKILLKKSYAKEIIHFDAWNESIKRQKI
jgi:molybdopterin/thiamine biosynthesis adenylyltransferase